MLGKKNRRTAEQIRHHYEVERRLAKQLRSASREERRHLYSFLYEELFRLVPDHPQLRQKRSQERQRKNVKDKMNILQKLGLDKSKTYLEIGPGDCTLAFHVANFVDKAYAVDVSETITKASAVPSNFKLFLSDGCSIPVPDGSVDIVFSSHLMEHLHPDDAHEQLQNIYKSLAPAGVYLCITPNRLTGPHDISGYFDSEATGFHLKEYTITELSALFKEAGFSKLRMYIGGKGVYMRFPMFPAILCERILEHLPRKMARLLTKTYPLRILLGIRLIGVK